MHLIQPVDNWKHQMRHLVYLLFVTFLAIGCAPSSGRQRLQTSAPTSNPSEIRQLLDYTSSHYPTEFFITAVQVSEEEFTFSERSGSPKPVIGSRKLSGLELLELRRLLDAIDRLPARDSPELPDGVTIRVKTKTNERKFAGDDLAMPEIKNLDSWIRSQIGDAQKQRKTGNPEYRVGSF